MILHALLPLILFIHKTISMCDASAIPKTSISLTSPSRHQDLPLEGAAGRSGCQHENDNVLGLIKNEINQLRQNSSRLHEYLVQEMYKGGIGLDELYVNQFNETMESILFNATLLARDLESCIETKLYINQSAAIGENDNYSLRSNFVVSVTAFS